VYRVAEIFRSFQGEGANLGRPTLFVRMAGCNYWTGKEEDRKKAICRFCDTDFAARQSYDTIDALARAIKEQLHGEELIVFTGGEPLLQLGVPELVYLRGMLPCDLAIETNGSVGVSIPDGYWVTVSPKARGTINLKECDEVKVVLPGDWRDAYHLEEALGDLPSQAKHLWVNPEDGGDVERFWCLAKAITHKTRWRVGIQAHKFWGVQ